MGQDVAEAAHEDESHRERKLIPELIEISCQRHGPQVRHDHRDERPKVGDDAIESSHVLVFKLLPQTEVSAQSLTWDYCYGRRMKKRPGTRSHPDLALSRLVEICLRSKDLDSNLRGRITRGDKK